MSLFPVHNILQYETMVFVWEDMFFRELSAVSADIFHLTMVKFYLKHFLSLIDL